MAKITAFLSACITAIIFFTNADQENKKWKEFTNFIITHNGSIYGVISNLKYGFEGDTISLGLQRAQHNLK